MNIKLKAILITVAIPLIAIALVYTIVRFPMIILLALLGGFMYFIYRGVLRDLERKERLKK